MDSQEPRCPINVFVYEEEDWRFVSVIDREEWPEVERKYEQDGKIVAYTGW